MPFPCPRFIRRLVWPCLLIALLLVPNRAPVEAATVGSTASPVGPWKTVDDATGKVKAIVVIREQDGKFYGTVERLFDPPVPHPVCRACKDGMKDRPIVGLEVLWGFRQDGNQWSGGQALDPENGKVYRASLALEDGGEKLKVRGYIGIPLFGRTQHWLRAQ